MTGSWLTIRETEAATTCSGDSGLSEWQAQADRWLSIEMRYREREKTMNPSRLGMRTAANVVASIVASAAMMPFSDRM